MVRSYFVKENNCSRSGDLFENDNTNTAAHELWSTFYRWISSSQSKLYDSALHKLVHKMITQVFYTMVTEVRKLGVTVIYADFNRASCTNSVKLTVLR